MNRDFIKVTPDFGGGGNSNINVESAPSMNFIQRNTTIDVETVNDNITVDMFQNGITVIPQFTNSPYLGSSASLQGLEYSQGLDIQQNQDGSLNFYITNTYSSKLALEMSAMNINFNISVLASLVSTDGTLAGLKYNMFARRNGEYLSMMKRKAQRAPFIVYSVMEGEPFENLPVRTVYDFYLDDNSGKTIKMPFAFYIDIN